MDQMEDPVDLESLTEGSKRSSQHQSNAKALGEEASCGEQTVLALQQLGLVLGSADNLLLRYILCIYANQSQSIFKSIWTPNFRCCLYGGHSLHPHDQPWARLGMAGNQVDDHTCWRLQTISCCTCATWYEIGNIAILQYCKYWIDIKFEIFPYCQYWNDIKLEILPHFNIANIEKTWNFKYCHKAILQILKRYKIENIGRCRSSLGLPLPHPHPPPAAMVGTFKRYKNWEETETSLYSFSSCIHSLAQNISRKWKHHAKKRPQFHWFKAF